jgi:magnesium chelatase family protein
MYAKVYSAAVNGIDGRMIEVESDVSNGLPQITIVGLPDSSIRESTERVRTAIRNCQFVFPMSRITVNLAPAALRKEGSAFDLAIAVGILISSGQLPAERCKEMPLVGELALDGTTKPVLGILSMVHAAKEAGFRSIAVPLGNLAEARFIQGIHSFGISHLSEMKELNLIKYKENVISSERIPYKDQDASAGVVDYGDVQGQQSAKRTMMIAAGGMHNVMLIGPPGSGKTMLLRRLPSILPPLTDDESLEVMKIYSIVGLNKNNNGLMRTRPFRSPHHTISYAGMLGGGSLPRPGEVSLAHRGVLFLDELPEFNRQVLEVLRQPLEDRFVTISRAKATLKFPTSFLLAASMNPCPCGFYGSTADLSRCICTPKIIQRYRSRLSGPLLDRIDMHTEVPKVDFHELSVKQQDTRLTPDVMRLMVRSAHLRQMERYKELPLHFNSELTGKLLRQYCDVHKEGIELLRHAFEHLGLSARAYDRILKIARTIADLEGAWQIETQHIAEAIQYRVLDRSSAGT